MTSSILLCEELTPSEANVIVEGVGDRKDTYLKGIFMQASIRNRNGRVYPLNEMTTAVKIAQDTIRSRNGILGELDHPQTLSINLDRVSHVITEMSLVGSDVIGKAKLLNTPMGNIARELINSGISIGVSSRGAGQVNESGGVSGFQFVTVDIVAQPSAPNAYPTTVFESLQQAKNGHNIVNLAEAVRHDQSAQQYLQREILKWVNTNIFAPK